MEGQVIKIREMGDPILEKMCRRVDIKNISEDCGKVIEDLKETFSYVEGFGIAAPQIGVNKRIIIIGVDSSKCKYENVEDIPATIMINPKWKPISDEANAEFEGCLSVPVIRGKVHRYLNIQVEYYDELGKKIKKEVSGYTARLIQHEIDHLDGVTFIQRVYGKSAWSTIQNLDKFNKRK